MKIKLDHVNLTVQNIQESVDWYAKIFGFKLAESGIGTRGQPWAIVASDDSMIVMNEYKNKAKADQESEVDFHKIYHFGIRVSDLATWENIVKENNLDLYYGGVVNYPFSRSWYVHDPSGHEIEVSHTDGPELRFPR
jgi:catechol 2,3-dioxygenase-like lactoylglutathione lyase family enzyme